MILRSVKIKVQCLHSNTSHLCIYSWSAVEWVWWKRERVGGVSLDHYKDKDKDLFIGPQEFVVGYSKAPEQPQSSARPMCHSHTMMNTGREPATIRIAAYRSSPSYALRHGRRHCNFFVVLLILMTVFAILRK